jgi:hypothetical protein
MDAQYIKDILAESNPEAIILDNLDEALVGIGEGYGTNTVAVYDKDKLLELLMEQNNWDYSEALEWYDFNIIGSYFSEYNPIFVTIVRR